MIELLFFITYFVVGSVLTIDFLREIQGSSPKKEEKYLVAIVFFILVIFCPILIFRKILGLIGSLVSKFL